MAEHDKELISGNKAKKIYNQLQRVSRTTDFEDTSFRDKDMLRRSLAILLMSEPIDKNEPFNVERGDNINPRLNGKDFKVESIRFSPRDTMVGGIYDIHFYALSPKNKFYYEFNGQVTQTAPQLSVNEAVLERVPTDGMDLDVK